MADKELMQELETINDITDPAKIEELLGKLKDAGLSAADVEKYTKQLKDRSKKLQEQANGGFENVNDWNQLTQEQAEAKSNFLEENIGKEDVAGLDEMKEIREFLGEDFKEEADMLEEYFVLDTQVDAFAAPGSRCTKEALHATAKEKTELASSELANAFWQDYCDNKLIDLSAQLEAAQANKDEKEIKRLEEEIQKTEKDMLKTFSSLKELPKDVKCNNPDLVYSYLGMKQSKLEEKMAPIAKVYGKIFKAVDKFHEWEKRIDPKNKLIDLELQLKEAQKNNDLEQFNRIQAEIKKTKRKSIAFNLGKGLAKAGTNYTGLAVANFFFPVAGTAVWSLAKGAYQTAELQHEFKKAQREAFLEFQKLSADYKKAATEEEKKKILANMRAQRDIYSKGFGSYVWANKEKGIAASVSIITGGALSVAALNPELLSKGMARAGAALGGGIAMSAVEFQKSIEAFKKAKAAGNEEEASKIRKEAWGHLGKSGFRLVTGTLTAGIAAATGEISRGNGEKFFNDIGMGGAYAKVMAWMQNHNFGHSDAGKELTEELAASAEGQGATNAATMGKTTGMLFDPENAGKSKYMWSPENAAGKGGLEGAGAEGTGVDDVKIPFRPGTPEYVQDGALLKRFHEFADVDARDLSRYLHEHGLLSPEDEAYYKDNGVVLSGRLRNIISRGEIPPEHADALLKKWDEIEHDVRAEYAHRNNGDTLNNVVDDKGPNNETTGGDTTGEPKGEQNDTEDQSDTKPKKYDEKMFDNYDNGFDAHASTLKNALGAKPIDFESESFNYENQAQLRKSLEILAKDNDIPLGQRKLFIETALAAKANGMNMSVGLGENGKPQMFVFDDDHTKAVCVNGVKSGKVGDFIKDFAENGNSDNGEYIDNLQERFCTHAREVKELQDDGVWEHKNGKLLRDKLNLIARKNDIPLEQRSTFVSAAIVAKDRDLDLSFIKGSDGKFEFFLSDPDGNMITSLNDENTSAMDKIVQRLSSVSGKSELKELADKIAAEAKLDGATGAAAAGSVVNEATLDGAAAGGTTVEGTGGGDSTGGTNVEGTENVVDGAGTESAKSVDFAAKDVSKPELGGTQHRFADGSAYKIGEGGTYDIKNMVVSDAEKAEITALFPKGNVNGSAEVMQERVYRDLMNREANGETLTDGEKLWKADRDYELGRNNITRESDGSLRRMTDQESAKWKEEHGNGSLFDSPAMKMAFEAKKKQVMGG